LDTNANKEKSDIKIYHQVNEFGTHTNHCVDYMI